MGSLFYKTLDIISNLFVKIYDFSQKYGKINFRYKRYYYDKETKLYYCNARYYRTELCRFIQLVDVSSLNSASVKELNLYCYCGNNPIMYNYLSLEIFEYIF